MVKWSKSLVKILIFRNVSKFHHVEKLGNTLKSDNVVIFNQALKLDPVVEFDKTLKFVYVLIFSSYSLP